MHSTPEWCHTYTIRRSDRRGRRGIEQRRARLDRRIALFYTTVYLIAAVAPHLLEPLTRLIQHLIADL